MAVDKVIGITVLSGKGGVGKSVAALNLSLALGRHYGKVLLFDAAGGSLVHLTNSNPTEDTLTIGLEENVDLYNSSIADSYSILSEADIEGFLQEIVDVSRGYDYVVFDCLTGAGPVSYTLAGLAELTLLVTTADPTSIAGTYLLAKALHQDGLAARSELIFNGVQSVDEAASLKTRFDILTSRFLKRTFAQSGYIHQDQALAESVMEQRPLLQSNNISPAYRDFQRLASDISRLNGLQSETSDFKNLTAKG
jgi:flagellar biosynthesis protein FlhG